MLAAIDRTRLTCRILVVEDDPDDVFLLRRAFQAAGESAGLPASECRATIRSALDWSIRTTRPRETA